MTKATKRERFKPFELVGIAALLGLFTGLTVLMASRDVILSATWFGLTFIITVVVLAMFVLAAKPNKNELLDIEEQNSAH